MKQALLVVCVLLVAMVAARPRWIAFNETYSVWMSEQRALELEPTSENFIDITDTGYPIPKHIQVDPIPTTLKYQKLVQELIQSIDPDNLVDSITTLSAYFTRYYNSATGKQAAQWVYSQFQEYSGARGDIDVEYFPHSFQMPSVIARIHGSSDDIGATRIILGGHQDSIGRTSTSRSPGADDDGSGTSTVLEVFRVLAQAGFKPNRTVEFHAYSGEEGGLLGSNAIAKQYSSLDIEVESMLQLDMTMYAPNPTQPVGIITDYTNPTLSQFIRLLSTSYSTLGWTNSKCGYGCSDHASWNAYGYRSAFPFEAIFSQSNPDIHTDRDVLANLSIDRGVEFAKIALGYVVEMAGGHI